MIRVAIVEDEAAVREQLAGYVQRCTRQYGTLFEVTMFTDGLEILEEYRPVYDIIFLDVEMPQLDGMETARRIRAMDSEVQLISITNMAQYAIKGYAVGALDYVLKPVPYFAFSQQLQKAVGQLTRRARQYLAVPVDGGMRRVDAAEVYYIESDGHRINFYTENGDFSAPGTLKTAPSTAATAAIWTIWRTCPACSRTRCRLARMSCRSAAPSARRFWPRWRIISGVAAHDSAGYSAALHRVGGNSGRGALRASRAVPHRKAGVLGHYGGLRRTAAAFLYLTGDVPLLWWIPCMAAAIVWIYLYLLATRELNLLEAGYCCARAFIVAEFAASVEWQFHCGIWPQRGAWEPLSLLLLAVVTAST